MYRARDRVENEAWIKRLSVGAESLDLDEEARSIAVDLFLSEGPTTERSKRAVAAASLYAAALIVGDERSQSAVAAEMDVDRLSIQQRWKPLLSDAGFEPPDW